MKKINKKAIAVVGLGGAALVGGTYAYYSQTASLDNPLSTGKYQTELVEDFTPTSEDLKPGAKIEKIVGVENTGDYPVMVRVKMSEKWVRKSDSDASDKGENVYSLESSDETNFLAGTYADVDNDGNYTFLASQSNATDGSTDGDGTVVYKHMNDYKYVEDEDNYTTTIYNDLDSGAAGNWIYNPADGYWYWNGVLEAATKDADGNVVPTTTDNLMEYLMIATNIDLGKYDTKEYYAIATSQPDTTDLSKWTLVTDEYDPDDSESILAWAATLTYGEGESLYRMSQSDIDGDAWGYADSVYTLTITTQVIQATTDAVADSTSGWGMSTTQITDMLNKIKTGDESDYINK
ncbi:MAG: BsaA family SipW-dependent biofilm matrix protein [Clostridiales bacterium]|nr:BsaA family SipW-dependent biofilm matrix protein [Clostridiales bacterium]